MIQTLRTATANRATRLALAIALLCIALQGAGLVELLRFDREAIAAGAWWRLLSGNFVHLGANHLWMNVAGLALVVALVWGQFDALEWAAVTVFGSIVVGLGLYHLNPDIGWYVGFSGTLHTLVIAGSIGDLRHYPRSAAVLLALVAGKLLWEQFAGALPGSEATAGGRVVVDAHLYGAIAGAVAAPLLLRHRRRRESRTDAGVDPGPGGARHEGVGTRPDEVRHDSAGAGPGDAEREGGGDHRA